MKLGSGNKLHLSVSHKIEIVSNWYSAVCCIADLWFLVY
jgi:hypothetical protein